MRAIVSIRRPSAAMVVALVALFAALGGTGYAAVTLSGRSIQKHTLPANRVVDNALGGGQINESKLGPVPTAQQAVTAQTATNTQQLQGRDAAAFLASRTRVEINQLNVVNNATATVTASCLQGEKGIGGGAAWMIVNSDNPTGFDAQLNASFPLPAAGGAAEITGWRAVGINRTGATRGLRAYVVCVPRTA
jgi:hypothetical protein